MRYLLLLLISSVLLVSCDSASLIGGDSSEGRIEYEVSFPNLSNDLLADVLPSEMAFAFKDSKVHAKIASFADIYILEVMTNNVEFQQYQLLKKNRDKIYTLMDKKMSREWMGDIPNIRYTHTGEVDTIAGFSCQKSIAYFSDESVAPVVLYYTQEIDIDNPNWYNPYSEIEGVLLAYDMEQFGMRMRLRAKEVSFEEVPDEEFVPSDKYTEVDIDLLKKEFVELVGFFDAE